jgi:hypothetical protein
MMYDRPYATEWLSDRQIALAYAAGQGWSDATDVGPNAQINYELFFNSDVTFRQPANDVIRSPSTMRVGVWARLRGACW